MHVANPGREPITLELINEELNQLVENINKFLKTEEALRLSAVRKEKQFKEMMASISHDLRTPLTAIKGYQQLLNETGLNNEQKEKLEVIRKYTKELEGLIEHFFEYTYLENAEEKMKLVRIELVGLVQEYLAGVVSVFEENNRRIDFCSENAAYAYVDIEWFSRIIHNLINNSFTHSTGDLTVRFWTKDRANLEFLNKVVNAQDIDSSKLFDRFYKVDKARKTNGGLGLSIVRLLTEKMGGTVEARIDGDTLSITLSFPIA